MAANAAGMIVIDPVGPGVMPIRPTAVPIHPVHPIRPGVMIVRPTPGPGHTPLLKGSVSFGLRLQGANVKVDINDQVAKTYITQTFVNDTDQNLAGTYLFPLPADTTFSSFSLHIDGKPVEGKILEANEARTQYEEIVRRMVDPGLLEYADYKTVRARIFPIPARGTKKVELEYTQLLHAENGLLKYRFPLKGEGDSSPAEDVKVSVKLESKQGLRTIWSPTHTIALAKSGDHQAKATFEGQDVPLDKDFLLYFSVSDKDLAANLLAHRNEDEDGYYLLTLTPPVESKQVVGKDIVLVADTSGSMQGERMAQSKKALKYLVNALNPTDRFSIVEFNTDVESFKPTLVAANAENKKAADSFIEDLEARGGTNLGDALKTASTIAGSAADRPAYLVLMTDGEPTVGDTTTAAIQKDLSSKRDLRVFDFGVGYEINTQLLNKLAEDHHGTAQYVEPDESMETALSSFYNKIKAPVLSNVQISYSGVQVKDQYPHDVKDIFAGSQVLLVGKYKNAGDATVQLTGTINGVKKAYSFPLHFPAAQADHGYLPRIWAMRRIGHLTDVAQANGNNREIVDEIISLSKQYGIISAYTSFLVTDPSENHRLVNNFAGRPMPVPPVATPTPMGIPLHPSASPVMIRRESVGGGSGGGMALSASADMGATAVRGSLLNKSRHAAFYNAPRQQEIVDDRPVVKDFRGDFATDELKQAAARSFASAPSVGKAAVERAKVAVDLKESASESRETAQGMKVVDDKTFYLRDGFWSESTLTASINPEVITFGSKQYFDLMQAKPGISKYLSIGRQVVFSFKGHWYKIVYSAIS
jgi:Ca-activated chloride channel family protein